MERYTKLETIGRGSYAKVLKVKLDSTGEIFAMKEMTKSLLKRRRQWSAAEGRYKNAYDDVLREVALMKKLRHPHVLRMVEVLDDPEADSLAIVLDFHANGALMDTSRLPDEALAPLPAAEARRLFADVVEGLSYLHFQSVVHFDLKPDNVLLSSDRRAIIADFGVSRLLSSEAKGGEGTRGSSGADDFLTSGSPGTPMYSAPEVWGDGQYYGKAADVWSLGVTLYVMVTGVTPFAARSHEALVAEVCAPEPCRLPPALAAADPALAELLARLLDKSQPRRISLAQVSAHAYVAASRPGGADMRRSYSLITVNSDEIRAAVTIAGHADAFARDAAGRIVKRTRAAERACYEAVTRDGSALAAFVPPYHGVLDADAVAALFDRRATASPAPACAETEAPHVGKRRSSASEGAEGGGGQAGGPASAQPARSRAGSLDKGSGRLSALFSKLSGRTPTVAAAAAGAEDASAGASARKPSRSFFGGGGGGGGGGGKERGSERTSGSSALELSEREASEASPGVRADASARAQAAADGGGRDVCIVLDDVTSRMVTPCVMDLKMGTRTFTEADMRDSTARPDLLRKMRSLDATAALPEEEAAGAITKLRYLKFREGLTTTRDLGFRVDAMKIGDDPTLNDSPLNFRQGPREPAAVLRELTRFVCASRPLAAAFAARLRALRCALEADAAFFPRYSLLRSSLLCTYDKRAVETATLSAPGPPVVGVHMIDFSSSEQARPGERLSHRAPWEPGNGEDGYLLGVDNLIKMFDKVERGEDWASESEDR